MKMTFDIRLCLFFCVQLFLYVNGSIPTEILCANPTCQELISEAKGSVTYISSAKNVLSFKPGDAIKIISKSKNPNDYWGAVINGRVGYVPSNLIKETRIFHQINSLVPVSIESLLQNAKSSTVSQPSKTENVKTESQTQIPSTNLPPVLLNTQDNKNTIESGTNRAGSNLNSQNPAPAESYKVVEGTTVYLNEPIITPSTTIDAKLNQQTPAFTSVNQQQQNSEEDRATIPPEVINLIGDYQGQILMRKENLTLENAEDADVSDGEEGDDENDDEEEGEEEEEELEDEDNGSEDDVKNANSWESVKTEKEVKVTVTESSSEKKSENKNEFQEITPPGFQPQSQNLETKPVLEKLVTPQSQEIELNSINPNEKFQETKSPGFQPHPIISENVQIESATNKSETHSTLGSKPNSMNPSENNQATTPPGFQFSQPNNLQTELITEKIVEDKKEPALSNVGGPLDSTINSTIDADAQDKSKEEKLETASSAHNPDVIASSSVPSLLNDFTTPIPPIENNQLNENELTTPQPLSVETVTYSNPYSVAADSAGNQPPQAFNEKPLYNSFSHSKLPSTGGAEVPTPPPPALNDNINKYEVPPVGLNNMKSNENIQERIQNSIQDQVELTTEESNFVKVNDIVIEKTTEKANKEETSPPTSSSDALENPSPIPNVESLSTVEPVLETEKAPGIFSQVAETVSGWFGSNADKPTEIESTIDSSVVPDLPAKEDLKIPDGNPTYGFESEVSSSIAPDVFEKPVSNPEHLIAEEPTASWTSWLFSSLGADSSATSSNTFMYLVVTAITVLMFTLGHSYIEKSGKTGPLIAKINKLEQELLVTSKECILLKEEVQSSKDKIVLYENSANDELVLSLQAELEESKKARSELESSIEVLQQELDAATEAGLDLNKMLSEVLTQKGGSESLLKSVESLQAQLNSQQQVIDEMTKKLGVKNQENEALQVALDAANEKSETLEDQIKDTNHNFNLLLKEKEDLAHDLKSQISQLQVRINQLTESKGKEIKAAEKKIEELQKKLTETSKSLGVKEEEFKSLKESVKQIKTKGNTNLEAVFDVSRIKAELAQAEKENKTLQAKLKEEENARKAIEETNKSFSTSAENFKKQLEEAEQKKEEAEKKLEVLSTYFKEKETQLQKELGMQEALWAQKKGDEKAVYNMMKSLQEEVDSYKSQNETLKQEILDQERGLKNQIATLEQKAHENWVAARQAERKLEETKLESAQLRNRLTLVEKNSSNVEVKANHRVAEELNGEPPTSPVLHDTSSPILFPPMPLDPSSSSMLPPGFMPHPMFMPPPMGGFIPPPPFLPGDRRPPPLGRMSSPPLNSRFSPSSPADYPFERMPSPPLSPPVRNYRSPNEADREHYRHRTPPYPPLHPRNWEDGSELPGFIPISSQRDSVREHKGSNVSSGHSSSDSLDKSSRHSGRV